MVSQKISALLVAVLLGGASFADAADQRPNFVIVLADDLGYGDLACYGHPRIQTPNLDRFASEGLKLTSCYAAAANCSPARAGMMTGRTPFRAGIYNWIPMYSPMHLRRSEVTVATLLRDAGYDTCQVGKWHLNGDFNGPSQPQPSDHGFNHWFATQNNALPNHRDPVNFVRNGKPIGRRTRYAAQLVAREAYDWLNSGRDADKPFFLFVCFHEPHEPIATDERFAKLYPSDDPSLSAHHGNVTQMDHAFGQIIDALDEFKLRKNTFVFFTSDNGPAITSIHPHGSAGPLRDKKGSLYEGGIRVPGIIRGVGRLKPRRAVSDEPVSDEPVSGVNFLPTLCELAGVDAPTDRKLDCASFVPLLSGGSIRRNVPLYWQFNRARSDVKVAIRQGNWKLLARLTTPAPKPSGEIAEGEIAAIKSAELTGFELYDLKTDIAEKMDVKGAHPDVFARLKKLMAAQHEDVRREAPEWPVWQWPRYEAQHIQWPSYRKNIGKK